MALTWASRVDSPCGRWTTRSRLCSAETSMGNEPLGRKNLEIYFESDDLDAVWNRLVEEGLGVAHPMVEQPWGQRVFRVFDPDGHLVEVGEPMPAVIHRYAEQGMAADVIAARTSMPLEIVQSILGQTL